MPKAKRSALTSRQRKAMLENKLTVADVMKKLGLSERTVRRYIALGVLKVERFGPISKKNGKARHVRISELECEIFLRTGGLFAPAS